MATWLAFKVAAKWEAWNHIGYVPIESFNGDAGRRWMEAQ